MADKSISKNRTKELLEQIEDKDFRIQNLKKGIQQRNDKICELDEDNAKLRMKLMKYEKMMKSCLAEECK